MSGLDDLPLFGFYPDSPGFKREGTSREAAEAMKLSAATLRDECLRRLTECDLSADLCAEVMGESVLSIRPRFTELQRMGLIIDSGKRRKNASGRSAIVWKVR